MLVICESCAKPLEDGDRVTFFGSATFRAIKSAVAYAFSDDSMTIETDSLCHFKCPNIVEDLE